MNFTVPNSPTGESFEAYERTPGCITVALTPFSPPIADYSKRPYSGSHVELFLAIMKQLRWCYYLVQPPENVIGIKENGNFTGALGMVARNEADMMMGPVALDIIRSEILMYAYGYVFGDSSLLYRRIEHVQPDVITLIKPFYSEVWLGVLVAVLAVAAAAALFNKTHAVMRHDTSFASASQKASRASITSRSLVWTWKIFVAQDLADTPRGRPGRMLTVFWLVASFMMASMYRCNLKAILINDKIKIPFTNIVEFVTQDEYALTWVQGKIYTPFLQAQAVHAPDDPQGMMWAKRTDLIPSEEIISTVLSKKIAVLEISLAMKSFVADDFSKHGECRVALADGGITPVFMSFGFPRHSPLRERVDSVLLRLVQAGIPHYLQEHSMRNASWCLKPTSTSESRPIAVEDLLGIFFIHGVGLTLGLVSFLLELSVHRHSTKSRSRYPHSGGRLPPPSQRGRLIHPQRGR